MPSQPPNDPPADEQVLADVDETRRADRQSASDFNETSSHERMGAAARRDEVASARDLAARARDRAAEARNLSVTRREGADDAAAGARASTEQGFTRAAGQRRRALDQRSRAAEQREIAAGDRRAAALDRQEAAEERRHALADREALIAALKHERDSRVAALAHQHRAEELARTLQRSLSPPRLPQIAGLDVAVHHEPSAPEEVGGDFYDLFPLAVGRSGFFLGDVCGKGPQAAAVTSLARYTMRTAAMLHEGPEAILMDLNSALRMEEAQEMQTCTAVYGEVKICTAAAAITLAVAGHPPPLIVRVDGSVEATYAHGTLLGAFDDPAFETSQIDLARGDAIVICSDGILDAEIDGIRVDERRVGALLSGAPHSSATTLLSRLVHALAGARRPLRDDVAIMALRRTPSD